MDTFKDLAARHDALMAEAPGMRIRDRARKLHVTEGELVARQLGASAGRDGPAHRLQAGGDLPEAGQPGAHPVPDPQ